MIKKILVSLAVFLTPLSTFAAEAVCELNGQRVECPEIFQNGGFLVAIFGGFFFVLLALIVFLAIASWKVFTKAGKEGWAVLIPFYNWIVLLDIVNRPRWWIFLLLIPVVNIVIAVIIANDLAKAFGKGTGFTVGLVLLNFVFVPILAFGSAVYTKPVRPETAGSNSNTISSPTAGM